MANPDRIYERTAAGQKALEAGGSSLRAEMFWVLGLIKTKTHADEVRRSMPNRYSVDRIAELLSDLEKLGFIESVTATTEHNPTGALSSASKDAYSVIAAFASNAGPRSHSDNHRLAEASGARRAACVGKAAMSASNLVPSDCFQAAGAAD